MATWGAGKLATAGNYAQQPPPAGQVDPAKFVSGAADTRSPWEAGSPMPVVTPNPSGANYNYSTGTFTGGTSPMGGNISQTVAGMSDPNGRQASSYAPGSVAGTFAPGVMGRQQMPMGAGLGGAAPSAPGAPATGAPGEMYGPQFGEKYGMSHVGQYDTPTALETFAQQQLSGNNPYYDRLRQQGMDQINQQMIARGHGNSGGALAALGNFQGALGAQQFADMGNLLQGAGSMGLNRMGQGQNTANQIQGMQDTRVQHQFGNLSDLAHLGAGNVGGFYGQGGQMSGDAAMAGINAGNNAASLTGQGQSALPNALMQLGNGLLAGK